MFLHALGTLSYMRRLKFKIFILSPFSSPSTPQIFVLLIGSLGFALLGTQWEPYDKSIWNILSYHIISKEDSTRTTPKTSTQTPSASGIIPPRRKQDCLATVVSMQGISHHKIPTNSREIIPPNKCLLRRLPRLLPTPPVGLFHPGKRTPAGPPL